MKDLHPHTDEFFMQRALQLALSGAGYVSPNPMVGCVIVHKGSVIGEGLHRKFGEAHAEVNAIDAVADKQLLSDSTLYVNLEPCSHFGKTPPCADLLIQHKIKKVVIANVDSNPLVGGKGIARLKDAGIEVRTGVLEPEGRDLNKRFFTFVEKKRPYVILKWAQTSDGYIARKNFDSKWISGDLSRQLVHRWRAEEAAILVGKNTVLYDNPRLNVRDWTGPDPVRVVIDKKLSLPRDKFVFDGSQSTIVYNSTTNESMSNRTEIVKLDDSHFMHALLEDLYKRQIQSVIVEGGAFTLQQFIDLGLWDEARVFTSSGQFGSGIAAPRLSAEIVTRQAVGADNLIFYKTN